MQPFHYRGKNEWGWFCETPACKGPNFLPAHLFDLLPNAKPDRLWAPFPSEQEAEEAFEEAVRRYRRAHPNGH